MLQLNDVVELRSVMDVDSGVFAEWQTPPMILNITVLDNRNVVALLDDTRTLISEPPRVYNWNFTQTVKQTHMEGVLRHLKKFREARPDYWSLVGEDIDVDLANYIPDGDWEKAEEAANHCPKQLFWQNEISREQTLWDLARASYDFYDAVFPVETSLRKTIDRLPMGSRINVFWAPRAGECVFNIPWGLFHIANPKKKEAIFGSDFWALRFRIHYHTHEPPPSADQSRALGDPANTNLGHVLYWQGDSNDAALREAEWQRKRLSSSAKNFIMPLEAGPDAKNKVVTWLESLRPTPMPLIHFYCKASVDTYCFLEFGKQEVDRLSFQIRDIDLPNKQLEEVRFVFCNACESGMPQAGQASNKLESLFIRWGCMAYLGTIHETPIELASRFGALFFYFFCNRIGTKIVSSGEATSQAKRFLWLKHRNLGGLFYNYVNEYDLYLADAKQIRESIAFPY